MDGAGRLAPPSIGDSFKKNVSRCALSLLVVMPPCRFDRRAGNGENLMRPGSHREGPGPARLSRFREIRKPAPLFDN